MSGYAATARIRGATPHLVDPGRDAWTDTTPAPAGDGVTELVAGPGDTLPSPPATLDERWAAFRERWSQLTFYLVSSEYWR